MPASTALILAVLFWIAQSGLTGGAAVRVLSGNVVDDPPFLKTLLTRLPALHSKRFFLAPKYWPLWFGFGVLRGCVRLPLRWQLALGRQLGRLSYYCARRRRHIAAVNFKLCFPDLSEPARQRLLKAQFESIGMAVFETAFAWWAKDDAVRAVAEIVGVENLHQGLASGRGVVLLTGHFTMLELGARIVAIDYPFHAMYRQHNNPLYEQLMREIREQRSGSQALTKDDVRGVMRALRKGRWVWYAPDQNVGRNSIFVPFFGVPARTVTAASRLAKATSALVIPYYPCRLNDGRYRVTVLPPLDNFPSDDIEADTKRINQLLEDWIRPLPEQYLWVHRRFRSRPEGEAKVY